jgi:hypothetical protein
MMKNSMMARTMPAIAPAWRPPFFAAPVIKGEPVPVSLTGETSDEPVAAPAPAEIPLGVPDEVAAER